MKEILKKVLCFVLLLAVTAVFSLTPSISFVSGNTDKGETSNPVITPAKKTEPTDKKTSEIAVDTDSLTPFTSTSTIKKSVTSAKPLMADATTEGTEYDIGPDAEYHKPLAGFADTIYNSAIPVIEDVYNGKRTYAVTDFINVASSFTTEEMESLVFPTVYKEGKELTERDVAGLSYEELQVALYAAIDWDKMNAIGFEMLDAVMSSHEGGNGSDTSLILSKLLCNMANELFWFDKTTHTDEYGNETGGMSSYFYFKLSYGLTTANVSEIYYCVSFAVSDEYLDTEYPQTITKDGIVAQNVSAEAIAKMRAAENTAKGIIEEARNMGLDDIGKIKYYHDTICDLITYDNASATNPGEYGNPWQMIYVFDGDTSTNTVCEGYAKAFKYLCDNTEFETKTDCLIVMGTLYQDNKNRGGHMWNTVIRNGIAYHMDVTNDDNDSDPTKIHTELFLMHPKTGEMTDFYYYSYGASYIHYTYDDDMFDVYTEPVLCLTPDFYYGDVNMDGVIDMADCVKIVTGSKSNSLDFIEKVMADIDKSKVVDTTDAEVLSQKIINKTN